MIIHPNDPIFIIKTFNLNSRTKESSDKLRRLIFWEIVLPFLEEMCPLRFILVFFSVALAGYFAWRTVNSLPPESEDSSPENITSTSTSTQGKQEYDFVKIIQNGFWVFIDMASGRYLWKNIRQLKTER